MVTPITPINTGIVTAAQLDATRRMSALLGDWSRVNAITSLTAPSPVAEQRVSDLYSVGDDARDAQINDPANTAAVDNARQADAAAQRQAIENAARDAAVQQAAVQRLAADQAAIVRAAQEQAARNQRIAMGDSITFYGAPADARMHFGMQWPGVMMAA